MKTDDEIRQAAIERYAWGSDDDLEINDDAEVDSSPGDGAWVQARVWVPLDEDEDEIDEDEKDDQ